ncbi:hypothetical protein GCM10009646_63260 [Streptomyces aureus]
MVSGEHPALLRSLLTSVSTRAVSPDADAVVAGALGDAVVFGALGDAVVFGALVVAVGLFDAPAVGP